MTGVSIGVRLRYESSGIYAPHRLNWMRRLRETADLARMQGRDIGQFAIVADARKTMLLTFVGLSSSSRTT